MKLKKTNIGAKAPVWNYSDTQIDTTEITQIRFAVYDNSPDEKAVFENKRYRGEIQIWTDNPHNSTSNYKLVNWFSNYKTFKNNKWKSEDDPHQGWYKDCVDRARNLNEEFGSDAVVGHMCPGSRRSHETTGYGFYNQAQWAMHLIANDQAVFVKVDIEGEQFEAELDHEKDISNARCHWTRFEVEQ